MKRILIVAFTIMFLCGCDIRIKQDDATAHEYFESFLEAVANDSIWQDDYVFKFDGKIIDIGTSVDNTYYSVEECNEMNLKLFSQLYEQAISVKWNNLTATAYRADNAKLMLTSMNETRNINAEQYTFTSLDIALFDDGRVRVEIDYSVDENIHDAEITFLQPNRTK